MRGAKKLPSLDGKYPYAPSQTDPGGGDGIFLVLRVGADEVPYAPQSFDVCERRLRRRGFGTPGGFEPGRGRGTPMGRIERTVAFRLRSGAAVKRAVYLWDGLAYRIGKALSVGARGTTLAA